MCYIAQTGKTGSFILTLATFAEVCLRKPVLGRPACVDDKGRSSLLAAINKGHPKGEVRQGTKPFNFSSTPGSLNYSGGDHATILTPHTLH
jgi:hypothetical protein